MTAQVQPLSFGTNPTPQPLSFGTNPTTQAPAFNFSTTTAAPAFGFGATGTGGTTFGATGTGGTTFGIGMGQSNLTSQAPAFGPFGGSFGATAAPAFSQPNTGFSGKTSESSLE